MYGIMGNGSLSLPENLNLETDKKLYYYNKLYFREKVTG